MKSHINQAGAPGGKENRFSSQKLHVQMAKSHRSPQSQTKTQPLHPLHFSLLSTFKVVQTVVHMNKKQYLKTMKEDLFLSG
jgi:hypothetical protein